MWGWLLMRTIWVGIFTRDVLLKVENVSRVVGKRIGLGRQDDLMLELRSL